MREAKVTALEFIAVLVSTYRGRNDDDAISIGHWVSPGIRHPELPDFYADISVTVGDLRRMKET